MEMEISSIESLLLSVYCESPACSSVTDSDIIAFGGYYYLSLNIYWSVEVQGMGLCFYIHV